MIPDLGLLQYRMILDLLDSGPIRYLMISDKSDLVRDFIFGSDAISYRMGTFPRPPPRPTSCMAASGCDRIGWVEVLYRHVRISMWPHLDASVPQCAGTLARRYLDMRWHRRVRTLTQPATTRPYLDAYDLDAALQYRRGHTDGSIFRRGRTSSHRHRYVGSSVRPHLNASVPTRHYIDAAAPRRICTDASVPRRGRTLMHLCTDTSVLYLDAATP